MARAVLMVLDSLGIGGAPDAVNFGDVGANTAGHIREFRRARGSDLHLPNLGGMGLWQALAASDSAIGPAPAPSPKAIWGVGRETARGKDTTTGHWEIACAPPEQDFHIFPEVTPCFPAALTHAMILQGDLPGVLAECHASGTEIIDRLGERHVTSGKPIVYTSADSVIQIAAHETAFGLERLYDLCRLTRELANPLMVGRVIARPFDGESGEFARTANRRDFAMPPFSPTILDDLNKKGRQVISVGKVSDIFAGRGVTESRKASGIKGTFKATLSALDELQDRGLVFSNIVEFDSDYGHRRDPEGYARALEQFDALLPELLARLHSNDMLILTADHGNDPTWTGTDHTREQVPILISLSDTDPGTIGLRGFSDIGATIADHLGIPATGPGESFLSILNQEGTE